MDWYEHRLGSLNWGLFIHHFWIMLNDQWSLNRLDLDVIIVGFLGPWCLRLLLQPSSLKVGISFIFTSASLMAFLFLWLWLHIMLAPSRSRLLGLSRSCPLFFLFWLFWLEIGFSELLIERLDNSDWWFLFDYTRPPPNELIPIVVLLLLLQQQFQSTLLLVLQFIEPLLQVTIPKVWSASPWPLRIRHLVLFDTDWKLLSLLQVDILQLVGHDQVLVEVSHACPALPALDWPEQAHRMSCSHGGHALLFGLVPH